MRLSFLFFSDSRTACSCFDSFTLQHTVFLSFGFPGVHVTTSLENIAHVRGSGQHLQLSSLLGSKTRYKYYKDISTYLYRYVIPRCSLGRLRQAVGNGDV